MKSFLKNVLANIVAIVLLCVVFFFFFIIILVVSSTSGDKSVVVKNNSVLTINLKTNIIDSPTEERTGLFNMDKKNKNVLIYEALEAIDKAKTDDKIRGISIEVDNLNAGITQIDDLRSALEDFKKSGKFVYAYGNTVSQASYYLGSVADKYYLNPAGMIELKGLATEVAFFKDFADKYGIGIQVIRHGKFKSAVEPFIRNDISPENREQLSTLLNDIWRNTSSKIAVSRKMDTAQFRTVVDSLYGMIPELGLKYKLADQLIQKGEYDQIIKSKLHLKEDDKLNKVSLAKYIDSYSDDEKSGDKVAVLYASGSINSGDEYNEIYSEKYIKYIKDLQENDKVKAVVFRINSPGGSANASDEILFELQQLKKKKPLIVSFGDYAASGGYYIAMAADKIYSEPNTLTGSIGVFGVIPYFKELANKNGVRSDIVATNANSQYFSTLHGVSPYGVNMITRSVEGTYKRFVHFVTQNRKQTFEQIDQIGGGRVWSGVRAKQIGLVDDLGTLKDAIRFAAQKAGLKSYDVTSYPKKMSTFEQIFQNLNGEDIEARVVKSKIGKANYEILQQITSEKLQSEVKMQMPYQIKIN
ncbi:MULTISPECIES: signal peptide peptidase SppA [Chryseobacterium]|uniref:Protease-4 n=1 Tax=Chryseobacterium camelliae TaxID=1265445 RepID=A0ABU0TK51_9FLAO|nr:MULTISPECIES: signal peptide peptidase SppA [Chryseobacterium]MDT3408724.1 protease-4 [Pseudacidovorax intermedius]MDQ1097423.1 protease-4 [Chryseobacterium camelliae]MDQ1101351.1 protease-4 [Chryseobacterium sp. SORGH_AS_1048]MDR6084796.1 protease-4 [Chryseobacterium sp. SORGH_AS_0909]MDR6129143.1 protease-4 [Chryseobacterium sp. SORGH_AS_1175]